MSASAEQTARTIGIWDRMSGRYDLLIAPLEKLLFRK